MGVYFITQNPLDIPESVLGQLGNRVQHALRAFTPRDQKAVKTAAETFRPNKKFDAQTAITELGVGEALVSFLDAKACPSRSSAASIAPPRGRIGPATEAERAAAIKASPLAAKYERTVDRESAYEVLTGRATSGQVAHEAPPPTPGPSRRGQYDAPPPADVPSSSGPWGRTRVPQTEPARRRQPRSHACVRPSHRRTTGATTGAQATAANRAQGAGGRRSDSIGTTMAKTATRTVTNVLVTRGDKGRHEERRLDPARRAGLDPEVASGLDHEGAFHVLVAVAAEDVTQESEAAGLSGTRGTRVSWPGTMSVRTPKSGILKPWMRSSDVSTITSGWPRLAVTLLGWNSNFLALMRIPWADPPPGARLRPVRCRRAARPMSCGTWLSPW